MAKKKYDPTGGLAFPKPLPPGHFGQGHNYGNGMTLRDYYAGQAMRGILSHSRDKSPPWTPDEVAVDAFDQADAMIAEKAKRESE